MTQNKANPFRPSFGSIPVWMAGRSHVIDKLFGALDSGPGNPNLCMLVSGARGSGKTALLAYVSAHAHEHGWVSADVTAEEGMLEDILQRAMESAGDLARSESLSVKSVSVPALGGIAWEREQAYEPNWRTRMNIVLDRLAERDCGLLITVDEVKPSLPEMVRLVSTYQHFVRERRRVGLLMAGLPHNVSMLLSDENVSFLRRAAHEQIGNVTLAEAEVALRRTFEYGGRSIDDNGLRDAANASLGYPYLMQLVGYRIWEVGQPGNRVTAADVRDGALLARGDFERGVLEATYHTLSDGDIRFLEAMLPDEGDSRLADIAKRMGVASNYASHYRRRLEAQGIVSSRRRGVVGVDLPLLKEYVASMCD